MTPAYLSQHYDLSYENSDQDQSHFIPSFALETKITAHQVTSSSLKDPVANLRALHDVNHQVKQEKHEDHYFIVGQSDVQLSSTTNNSNYDKVIDQISNDQYSDDHSVHGSGKWMPSKMRWMTKMMASSKTVANKPKGNVQVAAEQKQHKHEKINGSGRNNNSATSPTGVVRVCSECGTMKTPLWRSGPQGPKSLCNACGIRQRKARRAMAMAAAAVSRGLIPVDHHMPSSKVQKVKITTERSVLPFKKRCTLPFKKRCKMINSATGNSQQKVHFDDVIISLSNKSSSYKFFPQDEREAAILLMALSYGLIRG